MLTLMEVGEIWNRFLVLATVAFLYQIWCMIKILAVGTIISRISDQDNDGGNSRLIDPDGGSGNFRIFSDPDDGSENSHIKDKHCWILTVLPQA
jgi:hypothetical protein